MSLKIKIIVFIVVCIFTFPQKVRADNNCSKFKENDFTISLNVLKLDK